MMIVTVFLVPFAFAYFMAGRPEDERHLSLISFLFGVVGGICAMFIDSVVGLAGFMGVTGFVPRLLLALAANAVLPFAIGILPVFFLSESTVREKLSLMRSQLFGLAAIFLPYRMLGLYDVPDAWAVAAIPSMILAILFLADFFIGRLLGKVTGTPDSLDILYSSLPVIVALVVCVSATTLWFFCFPFWTYGIASFAVIGVALFLRIAKYYR